MLKNKIIKNLNSLSKFCIFLIIFSITGLLASMAIAVEKVHLLENPGADLSCTINPVYSCQSVITSDQASIIGIPNELIGIAFFGGLLALGLATLAGAKYKSWLHKLTWLGLLGSMVVVFWFFYQSVYNINALCIYCTTVWFATWTLFVGYSWWILDRKIVKLPKQLEFLDVFKDKKNSILLWFLVIVFLVFLVLNNFWYYYGQYFPF
jgi:uncharacterized membrane protein